MSPIATLDDGFYDLPATSYYGGGWKRANFSTLKYMSQSPAHYRHALDSPKQPTPAMLLGILAHTLTLEPGAAESTVAVWDGDRRGNAYKAFVEANPGKEIVKKDEFLRAHALAKSVRSNPDIAPHLADGQAERTILWTDAETGIQCRGRIDWLSSLGVIADLKTTKEAGPDAFGRQVFNFSYHAQAAFYQDGLFAATGERLASELWAVESDAPHVSQAYRLPDDVIAAGRGLYRGWLRRLADCLSSDKWPGYAGGPVMLELPRWSRQIAEYDDDETTNDDE